MSTSEIAKLESRWRENRQGLTFAPLAEAYRKMGDPAKALEVLGEGLAVNPNYIPASIVLGRCHLDLGDDRNAESAFAHVLDLDSENVIALRALADIAERGGRLVEARDRLESLLAVDRGNEEARAQLEALDDRLRAVGESVAPGPEGAKADDDVVPVLAEDAWSQQLEPVEEFRSEADETDGTDGTDGTDESGVVHDGWGTGADQWASVQDDDSAVAPSIVGESDLVPVDHLTPDAPIAPLDSLVTDDGDAATADEADTVSLDGLVGQEFESHRADVVPLEDLDVSPVNLASFDDVEPLDATEPVDTVEPVETAETVPADDMAEDDDFERMDDIERMDVLELTPSSSNEFQVTNAAEELAARLPDEVEPEDEWMPSAEAAADFPPLEAEPVSEVLQPPTTAEFETVAGAFGAEALDQESAEGEELEDRADETGRTDETDWADETDGAVWTDEVDEMEESAAMAEPPSQRAAEPPSDRAAEETWDDPEEPATEELVVTESMAELYRRQGHHQEALAVYRLLHQRSPDDFRLREKVDELETEMAAELSGASPAPDVVSLAAPDATRNVASLFRRVLNAVPPEPSGNWQQAVAPPARQFDASSVSDAGSDGAPTRPAADHLSLSDIFGEEGSPVPPAIPDAPEPGDELSFDAFFGDAAGDQARTRAAGREDDDLDQFQSWLQNLKR
jgi:Tfp pilus assembly protein PilF